MDPHSSAKKLAGYSFLVVFSNDDTIDRAELEMLKKIALEDRQIDDDERHVLRNIFSAVTEETVAADVWEEILRFRKQYSI